MNFNQLFKRIFQKLALKLGILLNQIEAKVAKASLPNFANSPINLIIDSPRRIINPEKMYFGDNVYLGPGSMIIAIQSYPDRGLNPPENVKTNDYTPTIKIGSRVNSSGNLTVAALSEVEIGDDVLFASNVNITDGLHGYQNVEIPYKYQPMERIQPIKIGRGCWIGQNVVILPGITIGEMTIVGANSVVTKDLPSRCIAFGSPAQITKVWDESKSGWSST